MLDQTHIIPGGGIVGELELDTSDFWDLCKHGLGLSVLMFLLIIGWALILGILIALGYIIGLIIGLIVLGLGLGYINSYLAEAVWEMGTDGGLVSKFFHGLLLLIVLIIANIPILAVTYVFPHWLISLILFIIFVPIHGFVGVKVAEVFEVAMSQEEEPEYWGD